MKLTKNSRGFSLVEGMIGIGLLAAVGLGAMKLAENQKKAARGQKQVSELPRTMIMIKQLVSDPKSCQINFVGKGTENVTIQELKNSEGETQIKLNDIIGKGEYQVTDMKLSDYSDKTSRAKLAFTFNKLKEGATSAVTTRHTFIHVEASGGTISKCLDPVEMSSESLVKRFCKDLDPKGTDSCEDNYANLLSEVKQMYCGSSHPFLKYDSGSGKCLPLDAGKTCGSAYIQGYDYDGNVICYSPSSTPSTPPSVGTCVAPAATNESIGRAGASESRDGTCPSGQKGQLKETRSVSENGTRTTTWSCPSPTGSPVSSVDEKWSGTYTYGAWTTSSSTCKAGGPPAGTKLWTCSYGSDSMYWHCRIENNLPAGVSVQSWSDNSDYSQRATLQTPESVCGSGSAWAESYVTFSQGVCN